MNHLDFDIIVVFIDYFNSFHLDYSPLIIDTTYLNFMSLIDYYHSLAL